MLAAEQCWEPRYVKVGSLLKAELKALVANASEHIHTTGIVTHHLPLRLKHENSEIIQVGLRNWSACLIHEPILNSTTSLTERRSDPRKLYLDFPAHNEMVVSVNRPKASAVVQPVRRERSISERGVKRGEVASLPPLRCGQVPCCRHS